MPPFLAQDRQARRAFSLLELMTVLVIISILAVIIAPAWSYLLGRAQKAKCIGNLRSLHVAAGVYIHDYGQWPQVPVAGFGDTKAAQAWIDTFQPYGLTQINWVCPAIQRALQSPDLADPLNTRVDYSSTGFSRKPNAPFQQARQPWFIESADVHGNGQEVIFPDGHIEEAGDIVRLGKSGPPATSPAH